MRGVAEAKLACTSGRVGSRALPVAWQYAEVPLSSLEVWATA